MASPPENPRRTAIRLRKFYPGLRKSKSSDTNHKIVYEPIGGQEGIGATNCGLLTITTTNGEKQQLVADCGDRFGQLDSSSPNLNWQFPNFSKIDFSLLVGIIITHGHLDHILGLLRLFKCFYNFRPVDSDLRLKIYGTKFTLVCIQKIFTDPDNQKALPELKNWENYIKLVELNPVQKIGGFTVHSFPVFHSIPDTVCFVVEANGKHICILHDFKFMRSNTLERHQMENLFDQICDFDIDILTIDSTNARVPGYTPSAFESLSEIDYFLNSKRYENKRIIIALFSTDVEMIADLTMKANLAGRQVEFLGRSMKFYADVAGIVNINQPAVKPPVIIATGSQAEEFAVLPMAARGESQVLELSSNDIAIIAARMIPCNIADIEAMIRQLNRIGVKVITTRTHPKVSCSGHECLNGLLEAIERIAPRVVVPSHGAPFDREQLINGIKAHPKISKLDAKMVDNNQSIRI